VIDWTDDLQAQIEAASRGALSYPGTDGYPVVLPLQLDFTRDTHSFTFPLPEGRPASASPEQASLTLLYADPHTKSERYLLLYGQLAEAGDEGTFTPSRVLLQQWRSR
jgi:hypothetical protein